MDHPKNKKPLMRRIAISLPAADLEEIEKLSQQKALSLSEYARLLIHLGLAVEKNNRADADRSHAQEQSLLWKTLLSWELETRFLVRHLVEASIQKDTPEYSTLLETAKTKAQQKVEELLQTVMS